MPTLPWTQTCVVPSGRRRARWMLPSVAYVVDVVRGEVAERRVTLGDDGDLAVGGGGVVDGAQGGAAADQDGAGGVGEEDAAPAREERQLDGPVVGPTGGSERTGSAPAGHRRPPLSVIRVRPSGRFRFGAAGSACRN